MPHDVILAIDAGTTGVTALVVDHDGAVQARGYREIRQLLPASRLGRAGPRGHLAGNAGCDRRGVAAAPDYRPIAVGLSNQRETMLFWDRRNGTPVYNAIVWQCRRSAAICEELRAAGLEAEVARKTGLRFDPYFSGTKALWLTRELPGLAARIAGGDVCFGTIDTWLAWRSDRRRSARHRRHQRLPHARLRHRPPRLGRRAAGVVRPQPGRHAGSRPSAGVHGTTSGVDGLPDGLPLASLVGDQQAALYGQCCFETGLIKATYGTGCFILLHTGEAVVRSRHGLLTSVAATTAPGQRRYVLEGSIFVAGAAVQWCRDNLGIIAGAEEGEALMRSVPDSGGVVFVPAFVGLGSPHWGPDVRGAIYGLTGATSKAHIVRAAMDSMVYQAQDVLGVMAQEAGFDIYELRVDGGAAANDALMQLQADLARVPISRPESVESTAMGAAYLAGLATGFWRDEAELASLRHESSRFLHEASAGVATEGYARWQAAVSGLLATELAPL